MKRSAGPKGGKSGRRRRMTVQVMPGPTVGIWERAGEYPKLFYEKLVPKTCDHQSSMLQDLERGKRTEIDALNGKIWSYARQLGLPTPFNETLTRLIRAKERLVPSAIVS